MDDIALQLLKRNVNKRVRIRATTGENILTIVRFVDEEHRDVVHDLISTDRPARYVEMGAPIPGAYVIPFEFIDSVQELPQDASG